MQGHKMPRSLTEFLGTAAVIGCGWKQEHCGHRDRVHADSTLFYTLDCNEEVAPDCIYNIENPLPVEFKQRFTVILLEHLPYFAYNSVDGFNNIFNMAEENGYIIIMGCPGRHQLDYRRQIKERNLRYVELNNSTLLIPKNQQITINELIKQIAVLNTPLNTICSVFTRNIDTLAFYECPLEINEILRRQNNTLDAFRKIYCALYHGQSSFFKRGLDSILNKKILSYQNIIKYCEDHPNSRSAFALTLVMKYNHNVSSRNTALFQEIHHYALQHSGFFKRTCNFPAQLIHTEERTQEIIEKANLSSRTGQIRTALGQ